MVSGSRLKQALCFSPGYLNRCFNTSRMSEQKEKQNRVYILTTTLDYSKWLTFFRPLCFVEYVLVFEFCYSSFIQLVQNTSRCELGVWHLFTGYRPTYTSYGFSCAHAALNPLTPLYPPHFYCASFPCVVYPSTVNTACLQQFSFDRRIVGRFFGVSHDEKQSKFWELNLR